MYCYQETKLADYIKDADLVMTGEGRLDHQTIMGKAPIGIEVTSCIFLPDTFLISKDEKWTCPLFHLISRTSGVWSCLGPESSISDRFTRSFIRSLTRK